jgi:hypothetical protein
MTIGTTIEMMWYHEGICSPGHSTAVEKILTSFI